MKLKGMLVARQPQHYNIWIDALGKFSSAMMTKLDLIVQSNSGIGQIHGRLFVHHGGWDILARLEGS